MAQENRISHVLARNNVRVLEGDGPVLLYAHGFGCNQSMWHRVAPAFAASHKQVLFDYTGSGHADITAFDVTKYASLNGYAQDMLDVCEALDLQRDVILVAHSVSCSIGMLAALARPELFSKLILIGPNPCFLNHPPDYHGGFERADLEGLLDLMDQNYIGWANYLAPVVAAQDAAGAISMELAESFCSTDPRVARVFAKTTFFSDNRADLPKLALPCLILQHAADTLAPLAVGEYVHAHLAGSVLKVLDVHGHCAHMSNPDLVVDAMREYLSLPS